MKKIIFFITLLLICQTIYAYDYVIYVDTASGGGGDGTTPGTGTGGTNAFATLSAAETYYDGVVGAGESIIFHCNRTSGDGPGGKDTTYVAFFGWNATAEIDVVADDFPSDGKYDDSKYVLQNTGATYSIGINTNNVHLKHLQFDTQASYGVHIISTDATNNIQIESCIFKLSSSGTQALRCEDSDTNLTLYNCTISGEGDEFAISIINGTANIYNSTVYHCSSGIYRAGGTATAKNCAVFNHNDDINGTVTLNYCATEDGDDSGNNGNITITQTADDYAALVVDAAGDDFSITNTSSELYEAAADDPGSGLYSDDITGFTRTSTWDIGAFEYDDSGGSGTPSGSSGFIKLGWKGAGKSTGKQN